MTAADRRRAAGALAGAAAVALVLGACASMPDHGAVMESTVQVDTAREIAFNVQGPAVDADPEQLVQSFVSVAQFAPANASTANVAREYVLPSAWSGWDRTSRVLVLSQYPEWETGVVDDEATTATVTGQAQVVATVDEIGVYTELPEPSPVDVSFELSRAAGGQWRISGLDDGLLVLANFLGDSFHRTTLSYPTPDREWWVPDVRWFPEQSWRTAATREILAGPPADLAHSTISVVPDGTTLALDAVTVDDSGVIEVSVTSPIGGASAEDRALLVAQLSETLRDREGRSVVLSEGTSPLATQSVTEPSRPLTVGDALALVEVDGATVLRRVVGRELTDTAQAYVLDGLDPTALGVAPDDGTVVVRDGPTGWCASRGRPRSSSSSGTASRHRASTGSGPCGPPTARPCGPCCPTAARSRSTATGPTPGTPGRSPCPPRARGSRSCWTVPPGPRLGSPPSSATPTTPRPGCPRRSVSARPSPVSPRPPGSRSRRSSCSGATPTAPTPSTSPGSAARRRRRR